jgi:hypothetical protein
VPGWVEGGLQALPGGGAGTSARPQPGAALQAVFCGTGTVGNRNFLTSGTGTLTC